MCKEMMEQRVRIENELKAELENCLMIIHNNGECKIPAVMVDLDNLFIANREYFEHQGFFIEPALQKVFGKEFKYFAWIKLGGGGNGNLGKEFWKKIQEAHNFFKNAQRKAISKKLGETGGAIISVNMQKLLFENKLYFEEMGYVFQPDIRRVNGKTLYYAWMKKKNQ